MNQESPDSELNKISFMGKLPPKRRRFLESKIKKLIFPKGALIINQDQPGGFLGILENGMVELKNTNGTSRTLRKGDSFGSEMLQFNKPSAYTITARSDTVISVLHRSDWLKPSPTSSSRSLIYSRPRLKKAVWIGLIILLTAAVTLFTLGPTLLEAANNSLPNRYIEAGRYDRAENYLRFAIWMQPNSAKVHGVLGDVLALQDKNEEAIESYQQALLIDEFIPWIHNNLGVLFLENGAIRQAEVHLLQARYLNPSSTDIYQNLGSIYYLQDRWEAAAAAYQNALDLDFSLVDAKSAWAGLILNESRIVEARLVWEDVLLTEPRHLQAIQGLGVVSLLEDDPTLALMYLDAARFLEPDDPTIRLYTGMALEALEKPEQAALEYKFVSETETEADIVNLANALLEVILD